MSTPRVLFAIALALTTGGPLRADTPDQRAALKAQLEKIHAKKSPVTEVTIRGQTVKVGDSGPLPDDARVEVMNLVPVGPRNDRVGFRDTGPLDRTTVRGGGEIRVLGFTDDKADALVEYVSEDRDRDEHGQVEFLMSVHAFVRLAEKEKARRDAVEKAKAAIRAITDGKSKVAEVVVGDRTVKVGDTAPVCASEWVQPMNLSPVGRRRTIEFDARGRYSCYLPPRGTVKALGFVDEKTDVLVEFTRTRRTTSSTSPAFSSSCRWPGSRGWPSRRRRSARPAPRSSRRSRSSRRASPG